MKRVLVSHIRTNAETRPPGYLEEMMTSGTVIGEYVEYDDSEYRRLVLKYSPAIPVMTKVASLASGLGAWASSGFPLSEESLVQKRSSICNECQWWDSSGFAHTGQCRLCGCATQAKWRMATEICPIGKW